jgi:hypothetical protein
VIGGPDFLYELLPEYLRFRDAGEGEPLRALLRVLQGEFQRLSANMDALYDDWFIETCAEWVVPYIGDLVGVRGLDRPGGYRRRQRALVGNTLANRRRKGVPNALGQTAGEATGWPMLAVPAIPHLAVTQAMAHPQPRRGRTVSLRDTVALDRLGTPFDTLAHTAAVTGGRGRYNLPGVGLFRWRLESYPVELSTAREVAAGCYTFHPFGLDAPLFNPPGKAGVADPPPFPADFPGPLSRRQLADERAPRRGGPPAFGIFLRRPGEAVATPVRRGEIVAADLADWRRPAAPAAADGRPAPLRVAVDPELGRLALVSGIDPAGLVVQVSYCYGFSADLGGGPYERPLGVPPAAAAWVAYVAADLPPAPAAAPPAAGPHRFPTLDQALQSWPQGQDGIIRILDSGTYAITTPISLSLGGEPPQPRRLSIAAAQGARPCLRGDLAVNGPPRPARPSAAPAQRVRGAAELELSGLWIDGQVILSGEVNVLRIVHTTLRPPARPPLGPPGAAPAAPPPSVRLRGEDPSELDLPSALEVLVEKSIVGPLRLPPAALALEVADSIVDGGAGPAIYGYGGEAIGPSAILARTTLFGAVRLLQLPRAEAVLFTAPVTVARPQQGEVLFSYLPAGSTTPRRVHCLSDAGGEAGRPAGGWTALRPVFTSTVYGAPGYAQLDPLTPLPLRTGSERGSEIGAFESLDQVQREVVLRGVIADYLRWGMSTEIVDVT